MEPKDYIIISLSIIVFIGIKMAKKKHFQIK
jgi:hypothetical protein